MRLDKYEIKGTAVTTDITDREFPDEFKLEVSVNDEFEIVENESHPICFDDKDFSSISFILGKLVKLNAFKDAKISVRRVEVK